MPGLREPRAVQQKALEGKTRLSETGRKQNPGERHEETSGGKTGARV